MVRKPFTVLTVVLKQLRLNNEDAPRNEFYGVLFVIITTRLTVGYDYDVDIRSEITGTKGNQTIQK